MRVLFCGSRNWIDEKAILEAIDGLSIDTVVIHGAAKGADLIAGRLATNRGLTVEPYPADWDRYHGGAGPIRNKRMLNEGRPTLVHAFVRDLTDSSGTANMVLQVLGQRGIPVILHQPDQPAILLQTQLV